MLSGSPLSWTMARALSVVDAAAGFSARREDSEDSADRAMARATAMDLFIPFLERRLWHRRGRPRRGIPGNEPGRRGGRCGTRVSDFYLIDGNLTRCLRNQPARQVFPAFPPKPFGHHRAMFSEVRSVHFVGICGT